jgi:Restriction endonuclease
VATPSQKGNALENAVGVIEHCILQTSPSLKEKTFLIENKKMIVVGNVHHEIDIFVTIDPGPGYKSFFIFECKNWQDAVGKNDIVIFSEKIDASQAQHGYFVARSFTKDARAQAAKDPRMTLLLASEHDPSTAPLPFGFHVTLSTPKHLKLTFYRRGRIHSELTPLDINAVAKLNGTIIDMRQYVQKWGEQTCGDSLLSFRTERLPEGTYERSADSKREFLPGELLLNDLDIEYANMSVSFNVAISRPAVISYFEVESRGRVATLAPVMGPEGLSWKSASSTGTNLDSSQARRRTGGPP